MDLQTCWNCNFVETLDDTMLEDFLELEDIDGNLYDEPVLVCPNCGKAQR